VIDLFQEIGGFALEANASNEIQAPQGLKPSELCSGARERIGVAKVDVGEASTVGETLNER